MDTTVVLAVGDDFHLRSGKDHIIYAGMPSENVYSIVQKKASGYQAGSAALQRIFRPPQQTGR